jgi:hypothetical protein
MKKARISMAFIITEEMLKTIDADDYMMDVFLFKQPKRNVLDKILDNNMGEMAQFYLDGEDSFNRWLDAEDY